MPDKKIFITHARQGAKAIPQQILIELFVLQKGPISEI
jgi:hypothetical protein